MDAFVVRKRRKTSGNPTKSEATNHEVPKRHKPLPEESPLHPKQEDRDDDISKDSPIVKDKLDKRKIALQWKKIKAENLDCHYTIFLSKERADALMKQCEETLTYNTGKMAQVHIFGKWIDIPRKQVAYGDAGLSYTFSNNEVPARPWITFLQSLRDEISSASGQRFNFVLINRYENGNDHMGEHRDDEKDLVRTSPIASLSLGQERDFIFKHAESRGKNATRQIPTITQSLEHGSLLLMNYPTNNHWYHALPKRKRALGVRINMTFRDFVVRKS